MFPQQLKEQLVIFKPGKSGEHLSILLRKQTSKLTLQITLTFHAFVKSYQSRIKKQVPNL